MRPKPLDLEEIKDELDMLKSAKMFCLLCNIFFDDPKSAGIHFREEHNDEDIDKIIVRVDDITRNVFVEYFKDIFITKIKQRIKSACEFYLKYKDNPLSLSRDFPHLKKEIEKVILQKPFTFKEYKKSEFFKILKKQGIVKEEDFKLKDGFICEPYKDWLFKLAFKDVLGGEE